ncbi:MAG TPA: hypothetical protein VIF60_22480 [Burkholderiaceae bacterium]|jgi:hypothetical protein
MEAKDRDHFLKMLSKAMGAYGKPLPEPGVIAAWLEELRPYPISLIGNAFRAYCDENGEFAPLPAALAKRCKLMDGRPSDDEAWAVALTSRDEANTVVWTQEMAEAFALCLPVFPDEVGARMAFKDAHKRLVAQARAERRAVAWGVSLGWDTRKREIPLTKALNAGLLPAPVVAGLLPSPEGAVAADNAARVQIEKIKKMVADMAAERARRQAQCLEHERDALAAAKARARSMAASHRPGGEAGRRHSTNSQAEKQT